MRFHRLMIRKNPFITGQWPVLFIKSLRLYLQNGYMNRFEQDSFFKKVLLVFLYTNV